MAIKDYSDLSLLPHMHSTFYTLTPRVLIGRLFKRPPPPQFSTDKVERVRISSVFIILSS